MPLSWLQQLPWPTVEQASSHCLNPFSLHPSSHCLNPFSLHLLPTLSSGVTSFPQCSPPAKRHSRRRLTLSIPPPPHSPTLVLTTAVSYLRTISDVGQHCAPPPAVRLFTVSLSLQPHSSGPHCRGGECVHWTSHSRHS